MNYAEKLFKIKQIEIKMAAEQKKIDSLRLEHNLAESISYADRFMLCNSSYMEGSEWERKSKELVKREGDAADKRFGDMMLAYQPWHKLNNELQELLKD